jgi:hypothetical protein
VTLRTIVRLCWFAKLALNTALLAFVTYAVTHPESPIGPAILVAVLASPLLYHEIEIVREVREVWR